MNNDYIDLINDLVVRTENEELTWEKTKIDDKYILFSEFGEISIYKSKSKDIDFHIKDSKDNYIVKEKYLHSDTLNIQLYKITNVLWLLVKDLNNKSAVDLGDILDYLEEDDEDLEFTDLPKE